MTKTRRSTKVMSSFALYVVIAHFLVLVGCSKKEDDSQTQPSSYSELELRDARHKDEAVGDYEICYRGDKYIAIREAYQHASGWIAFKIETNLAAPFDFVYRPEAHEYCRDKENLTKWGFEENEWMELHRLMWQGAMTDGQDTPYLQEPRNKRALIHFDANDGTKTQWRIGYPDDGFLSKRYATRLTFRALSNVRNRTPDQSPADYMDWKNNPGKFQMFDVTFHVPKASEERPNDIEADMKAVIDKAERQMLLRRIPLLEDPSAIENSFAQFRSWPKGERMRENLAWLSCLAKHGQHEEAAAYLQEYRAYVEEVDQDGKKQFKTVLLPQAERYFERLFGRE
jgi:hypothetical protein